jgi:hypothetical protein|tara:strand:- start:227 stop:982 length:756 start_codon:yes stop_codon:yes gene_type:complete
MQFNTTTHIMSLSLGIATSLLAVQLATATPPTASVQSISPPSGGKLGGGPIGSGGHYEGPGDTVPPCDGCPVPPVQCEMPLGNLCDAPVCEELDWVADEYLCKFPVFGIYQEPVWTQGFMLTMGDIIEALQSGAACADEYGNITACIDSPFPVDEVHVFESGWINGYAGAPIGESVSATVCFDGTPTIVGWSFDQVSYNYDCELATVCLTFSAECMQSALMDWYASGVDMSSYSNSWLFYVDFISCDPCEE